MLLDLDLVSKVSRFFLAGKINLAPEQLAKIEANL
jgi:hypothetical protein